MEKALAGQFTQATGDRIRFTVGTVREIQEKLSGPEKPDVVVLPTAALDVLERAVEMRTGLGMDGQDVGPGIGEILQIGIDGGDHEMDVEG